MPVDPPVEALRIAHVLSSFGMGGQERVALELARAHRRAGHDVIAISLASRGGALEEHFARFDIPTFSIGSERTEDGLQPRLLVRLAQRLRDHGTQLVHTHNPKPLIYAPVVARLCGAQVIHTKHGKNPSGAANLWLRRLTGALASSFVCVSDTTARQARQRMECREALMSVIPNGIDTVLFSPADSGADSDVRNELGIGVDDVVVGTVGRIDDNKNHELMIQAIEPMLGAGCHLVIVGDGPRLGALEDTVEQRGLAEYIHLTGLRSDVPRLMAAFDVFVLSSDSEGLPLVIPEAMACGVPVVATAVGGVPSVVEDGRTGALVPPRDAPALRSAIHRLITNPDERQRSGERARARAVELYSVDRMAERYLEIYCDAIRA